MRNFFERLVWFLRPGASSGASSAPSSQASLAVDPVRPVGGQSVGGNRVEEDPSLPHVEDATDPELMRAVFQRHLRPLEGKEYEVRECEISFALHRRNVRFVAHYELRLGEVGGEREFDQLVTGVTYAGARTRLVGQELIQDQPIPPPTGPAQAFASHFYVPELDMLAQGFPHDLRLPAVAVLTEGPPPELGEMLLARLGPGNWDVEAWKAETVRYRVDTRATLRLTMRAREAATGRTEERRYYAKVYRERERSEEAHRVARQLWETATGDRFTVGRPVAYLGKLKTLVQEELSGTSLDRVLRQEADATWAARKVARALAALHQSDVVVERRRGVREETGLLKRAAEDLRSAHPRLVPEVEEILDAAVAGLEEVPPSPTHGELRPWHMLLEGDRLSLLDLDTFAAGDPVSDAADLAFTLARTAAGRSHLRGERARAVARAFVGEYFDRVPEAWRARFPVRYAGIVLKKAAALARQQAQDPPEGTESLLQEARDSLKGKIW